MSGDVKDPKVPTSVMRSGRVIFRYNEIELPTPEGKTSNIFQTTLYPSTRLCETKSCIRNSLPNYKLPRLFLPMHFAKLLNKTVLQLVGIIY